MLFGGSVNAGSYFTRRTDIDGGLLGGANQDLTSFQALIETSIAIYSGLR